MKKWCCISVIFLLFTIVPTKKSHAIVWVVVKAAAKKVIKALDLQVQRMQNRTIGLQNAQKALENTLSKLKLNEISSWAEKQRAQYSQYYEELRKVRNTIAYYRRIKEIIQQQLALVDEYRATMTRIRSDKNFRPQDLEVMTQVYSGIFNQSLRNIEDLQLVVNSFKTEMSDAARLELIAVAAGKIETNYAELKAYNRSNLLQSMQRTKNTLEVNQLRELYNIHE